MNKLLLTIAGLAAGLTALAQGTINVNNNFTAAGASAKAFVLGIDGLPASKATTFVDVTSLDGTQIAAPKALTLDGEFFMGVLAIPGVATGGSGDIYIRAWDSTSGSGYANAITRIEFQTHISNLGGGTTPPAALSTDSNFVGMQLVGAPEPSTIALAALGVAGLFFVVRRK